jgi:predicted PurR-regulated permease PerM
MPHPQVLLHPLPSDANQLMGSTRELGAPVLAPLGRAGIIVVFTVFMLLKREDLRNRLLRLAGLSPVKPHDAGA